MSRRYQRYQFEEIAPDDNSNGVGGPEFCTSTEGQTGSCGRVAGSRDEKGFVQ